MDSLGSTHLIATALVFAVSLVFSMLGLGGAMLYVPIFKWLELPLKTVAIPLGLSALLARRSGGFSRRLPAPRRAPGSWPPAPSRRGSNGFTAACCWRWRPS